MEKILNFGFVVILVSCAIRFFIVKETGAFFLDFKSFFDWEVWLYSISAIWFCLAFWNVLIRRRCSKCRDVNYFFKSSEEIDRWIGTKKVREKIGDNSYADRNVTTTFVKVKNIYECLACGHIWFEIIKNEKS